MVTLHLHVQVRNPVHSQQQNDNTGDFGTTFHYQVVEGACETKHYGRWLRRNNTGLELAKLAALPEDVLAVAQAVSRKLTQLEEKSWSAIVQLTQAATRDLLPPTPSAVKSSWR